MVHAWWDVFWKLCELDKEGENVKEAKYIGVFWFSYVLLSPLVPIIPFL